MWLWIWFMIIKKAILIFTTNTEYTNFDPWAYCNDIPTWNMYFLTNTPKVRIFFVLLQMWSHIFTYILCLQWLSCLKKRGRGSINYRYYLCKCLWKNKNFFLSFFLFKFSKAGIHPYEHARHCWGNLGSKFEIRKKKSRYPTVW